VRVVVEELEGDDPGVADLEEQRGEARGEDLQAAGADAGLGARHALVGRHGVPGRTGMAPTAPRSGSFWLMRPGARLAGAASACRPSSVLGAPSSRGTAPGSPRASRPEGGR